MREVVTSYQELIGDGKNIAICMAGLPHAVSGVLNDKVLTFLNRATKIKIGEISMPSIRAYYEYAFGSLGIDCPASLIESAAEATRGIPHMMQLIGYYLVQYSQVTGASIQMYRKRLKEAGIIESPRRGELTFAVPYLADYLVKLNAE